MKIKELKIHKSFLRLECRDVSFAEGRINLITGKNGAGKTTLMEALIFENHDVEFPSPELGNAYLHNRAALFAYVPQYPPSYPTSVEDYLFKGEQRRNTGAALDYFQQFGISHIKLADRFDKLSGGERVKLSILSALLKNSPYVFMDEPTNHLDNESVQTLMDVLGKLCAVKTFVLICHDPRVDLSDAAVFALEGETLRLSTPAPPAALRGTDSSLPEVKKSYRTFAKKALWTYTNYAAYFLFCALIGLLLSINKYRFESDYSDSDPNETKPNIILAYTVEPYYEGCLNQRYAEGEGLSVAEVRYETILTYKDLAQIANYEGIEKILLEDPGEFDKLLRIAFGDDATTAPQIFSVPEDYLQEFSGPSNRWSQALGNLQEGRYPRDEAGEICVPKTGISGEIYAVGEKISIEGRSYEIVGLLDNPRSLCLASYTTAENRGFYRYEKESFDQFIRNLQSYVNADMEETVGYSKEDILASSPSSILIYTSRERETLNALITTYPATVVSSYWFGKVFQNQYNRQFVLDEILPINLILSLIMSVFILIVRRTQFKVDGSLIQDFSNYYISKKQIRRYYFAASLAVFAVLILLPLLLNRLITPLYYAVNPILLLDMSLVFLPSLMMMYGYTKKCR